jgi:phage-related protein
MLAIAAAVAVAAAIFTGGFGAIVVAISAVVAGLVYLYTHNATFKAFVDGLVSKISEFVGYVKAHWPEISAVIQKVWTEQIEPTLMKFGKIFQDIWDSYLLPFFGWVKDHWKQISDVLKAGGEGIVVMFQGMGTVISWLYFDVFKPMLALIGALWSDTAKGISGVYNNVLKPVWGAMTTAFDTVGKAFSNFRDGLSSVWGDIKTMFTDGVNFVTQDVLNKFIDAINAVTSLLGIPKIPDIAKISTAAATVGNPGEPTVHRAVGTGSLVAGSSARLRGCSVRVLVRRWMLRSRRSSR